MFGDGYVKMCGIVWWFKIVMKGTEVCAVRTLSHATQQPDFLLHKENINLIEQCAPYNVVAYLSVDCPFEFLWDSLRLLLRGNYQQQEEILY